MAATQWQLSYWDGLVEDHQDCLKAARKIRFDKDFNQAYIGVYWTCDIGGLGFVMHLTLAKWDPADWWANATFGYDNLVTIAILKDNLGRWMIATSPELMIIG